VINALGTTASGDDDNVVGSVRAEDAGGCRAVYNGYATLVAEREIPKHQKAPLSGMTYVINSTPST